MFHFSNKNSIFSRFSKSDFYQKIIIFYKIGRCRQVFVKFRTTFRWSLVVVGRWSLFKCRFITKFAWAGFGVVVVDRWSLFGGGRQHRFDCALTYMASFFGQIFNGTMSVCRHKQEQKGNRKFPPASIFALGLRSENSLKNHVFYQK